MLDDDCMSTDVPDDDDCVSVCSDDSTISRVHYQDAVEHWWKQSGRGAKHSDFIDIPPQVDNDDDSLDDECLSESDAVEEPAELPPDIATYIGPATPKSETIIFFAFAVRSRFPNY